MFQVMLIGTSEGCMDIAWLVLLPDLCVCNCSPRNIWHRSSTKELLFSDQKHQSWKKWVNS